MAIAQLQSAYAGSFVSTGAPEAPKNLRHGGEKGFGSDTWIFEAST